jgi:uncharacterized protein (DUF486 family)
MYFVYGTVILVAAIVLLGIAKFSVSRLETSAWVRRFAATETMALIITTMSAFGIAFLCAGLASNEGGLGHAELAAALGVVALAVIGVVRVFRRRPAGRVTTPASSPSLSAAKSRATI